MSSETLQHTGSILVVCGYTEYPFPDEEHAGDPNNFFNLTAAVEFVRQQPDITDVFFPTGTGRTQSLGQYLAGNFGELVGPLGRPLTVVANPRCDIATTTRGELEFVRDYLKENDMKPMRMEFMGIPEHTPRIRKNVRETFPAVPQTFVLDCDSVLDTAYGKQEYSPIMAAKKQWRESQLGLARGKREKLVQAIDGAPGGQFILKMINRVTRGNRDFYNFFLGADANRINANRG
jgi:hypothetical protein